MPKPYDSIAFPSAAAFVARLTAASSVTVLSLRRSFGWRRFSIARNSTRWHLTAAGSAGS
ncbi:hypothetical protein AV521_43315 [Streptomyces sp. IMTB 2501]|nr:hypothetical protein AV521_43315 [Streptomyces sp. IMTB 2501]